MRTQLRGNILSNFMYLVMFLIVYFIMTPLLWYIVDTVTATAPLSSYPIPSGTIGIMQFLIYVLVPIMAVVWTILSSSQPQYQNG
jgi:hypothetical protein